MKKFLLPLRFLFSFRLSLGETEREREREKKSESECVRVCVNACARVFERELYRKQNKYRFVKSDLPSSY